MRIKGNPLFFNRPIGNQNMFGKKTLLILFLSTSIQAAASNSISDSFPGWSAGLIYATGPSPFVGNTEIESQALPLIGYSGDRLTWLGPHLSYRLNDEGLFSTRVVAELRFTGLNPTPNDPLLSGLTERQSAIEIGFDVGMGPITFSGRQDISDKHNSSWIGVAVGNEWALAEGIMLEASVNGEWQHKDFTRYYYGVEASEATSTRPSYTPGSGVNVGADIQLSLMLTSRASFFVGFDYTAFDSAITNSPIVGDDSQYTAFAGFIYHLSNRNGQRSTSD
ncbi:MAG: outer membrane scaffolding protein for murein synthesis (MipA/OmpV family) [Granulosicoccus sp.]|jgi:outer membrane scaffolding protein for murein synthesis (MipA/OmpV family)